MHDAVDSVESRSASVGVADVADEELDVGG